MVETMINRNESGAGEFRPLQVLSWLVLAAAAVLTAATIAGVVLFVLPTLTGSSEVWIDGEVSGLALNVGDLPREIGEAKTVAEQLDLPGTNNRGRFVFQADRGAAEVDSDFQPARFVYDNPSFAHRVAAVLGPVFTALLMWVALLAISRLIRSCRNGEPFATSSVTSIRALGTAALLYQAGTLLYPLVLDEIRPLTLGLPGLMFHEASSTHFHWLVVGFGCFALAEVFAHGRHLHLADLDTV